MDVWIATPKGTMWRVEKDMLIVTHIQNSEKQLFALLGSSKRMQSKPSSPEKQWVFAAKDWFCFVNIIIIKEGRALKFHVGYTVFQSTFFKVTHCEKNFLLYFNWNEHFCGRALRGDNKYKFFLNISKTKRTSAKKLTEHCLKVRLNKTACKIWNVFNKVHFWAKHSSVIVRKQGRTKRSRSAVYLHLFTV